MRGHSMASKLEIVRRAVLKGRRPFTRGIGYEAGLEVAALEVVRASLFSLSASALRIMGRLRDGGGKLVRDG